MFRIAGMLLTAFTISVTILAQPATKYVDISFNLVLPITMHEPVVVDVEIRNLVSYPISLDLGAMDKWFFHFLTATPDGKQVDITNEGRAIVGPWHAIHIRGNDTYHQRLLLDELYSFNEPGNYFITASSKVPVAVGEVNSPYSLDKTKWAQVFVKEAKLKLIILPYNRAALQKRCDELESRLRDTTQYEYGKILPIAQELSFVKDPVAIPYLSKLIDRHEEWFALEGLRRINTDESWEAMIPITKSWHDASTATYAKKILRDKLSDIRDPRIRKRIADAVQ